MNNNNNSSSVDTVNAAANAIISADTRVQQITVPRRWGACFGFHCCFGSPRHTKRINHAVLVPEPVVSTGPDAPVSENSNHSAPLTLPFTAPPSSPASFLNSEPHSTAQSPGGFLSFSTLSANAYSPTGPSSIFAIGPYAHETQLVSPPVFSNFTTEPNTAPFTPPPESVQMTTPSSPEVPFAQLLSSFDSNCKRRDAYEFQSYHLYPGSPIGRLISPSSVCSGTSSPFIPDQDFHTSSVAAARGEPAPPPSKILTAEEALAEHKLILRNSSQKHDSVLDGHTPSIVNENDDSTTITHRVSFELTAEEVLRCMEKKPAIPEEATRESSLMLKCDLLLPLVEDDEGAEESNHTAAATASRHDDDVGSRHESPERIESSGELVASKEFKFSNSDGATAEPSVVGSEWWVNEKKVITATAAEVMPPKKWAFFPMVQPGVS